MNRLGSNISKIYIYKFLSEFYLVMPILIPYYEFHRLSTTQIFTVQAAYALSFLLFEIPSGYLADVMGRRTTLILGGLFFPIGLAMYAFSGDFLSFMLAEFILALGNSMRSGSDSALIFDTLKTLDMTSAYTVYEGRTQFFTRIGTSTSSIMGGLLALSSLKLPFYVNIATGSLMLPLALSLIEPPRIRPKSHQPMRDILRVCRRCFQHRTLRLYILYLSLVMSTGIIGVWSYFLFYGSLGILLGYFGLLFALFQLSSAIGSAKAHSVVKVAGEKTTLCLPLAVPVAFIVLGCFPSPHFIPLIFLNAYLWGQAFPLIMEALNKATESEVRATVLSVATMAGSLSYVILAPLFGGLVDRIGLPASYIILGIISLAGMMIVLKLLLKNLILDTPQDRIGLNG